MNFIWRGFNNNKVILKANNKNQAIKRIFSLIKKHLPKYYLYLISIPKRELVRHLITTISETKNYRTYIVLNDIRLTCGVFILNKYNELVVGRVTNSNPVRWDIPKGQIDIGIDSDFWDAAVRECYEETGINLYITPHSKQELPFMLYNDENKNRPLHLIQTVAKYFIVTTNEEFNDLNCLSMFETSTSEQLPELDIVKTVKCDELPNVHYTQKYIIENAKINPVNYIVK